MSTDLKPLYSPKAGSFQLDLFHKDIKEDKHCNTYCKKKSLRIIFLHYDHAMTAVSPFAALNHSRSLLKHNTATKSALTTFIYYLPLNPY